MNDTATQFTFLTPSKINATSFEGGVFLFTGNYAAGKSYLAGDACAYYHNLGKRFLYFNVGGEDGQTSAMRTEFAHLEYPAFIDVPSSPGALRECPIMAKEIGAHITIVDSLTQVYRIAEEVTTKGIEPPKIGKQDNEWLQIHMDFDKIMRYLKDMSEIVIFLCPADLGADQIMSKEKDLDEKSSQSMSNKMIVPDLPGKLASRVLSYCDLAGYIKADYLESQSKMQRRMCFTNPNKYKVRQRLPKEITYDILLPQGPGGWEKILGEIQKAYGQSI